MSAPTYNLQSDNYYANFMSLPQGTDTKEMVGAIKFQVFYFIHSTQGLQPAIQA